MSVTINESGLRFGEYTEANLFYAEKSKIYESLGKGIHTVEFALYKKNEILIIESKSSSPKPYNKNDFDSFIDEIYEKFSHSIDLYFALVLGRLYDKNQEMPDNFKKADYTTTRIKLLLVINGHNISWLAPISEALKQKLRRQIKTWLLEVAVMNHELAEEYGLLC